MPPDDKCQKIVSDFCENLTTDEQWRVFRRLRDWLNSTTDRKNHGQELKEAFEHQYN